MCVHEFKFGGLLKIVESSHSSLIFFIPKRVAVMFLEVTFILSLITTFVKYSIGN